MKNHIKSAALILGIAALIFFSLAGWFGYRASYKISLIGREESRDGRTAIIFQMRGTPAKSLFNLSSYPENTKGRFIVERDGKEIKTEDFTVFNQGEPLQADNWEVQFYPAGAEITLYNLPGAEAAGEISESGNTDAIQNVTDDEQHIVIFYDEANLFERYSDDEIIFWITDRYGHKVSYLNKENDKYYFQADGFVFSVNNDFRMTDNYEESYFDYLAQQFSYDHNRITEFEKIEDEDKETVYIPVVGFHGRQPGESESFSNACCDLMEELQSIVGFEKIGYFSAEHRHYFDITSYLDNYDRTEFYNAVYHRIEQDSLEEWQSDEASGDDSRKELSSETPADENPDEMPAEWKNYEADCSYRKKDGTELRMVGVDRAAGSSYYVLLEAIDGINTSVINTDPYLGHGGYAKWIDFLEDEEVGFSCLAYSGGSLGLLFRTEDGGKSFQEITYPSAKIKLPDGSLYNPFIMPAEIWEEDGTVYMKAGQGPDGDYYENGVHVSGLYESEDAGKNWSYTGTIND